MTSIDEEIVKFMDFLDLDEAHVDEKLQIFMQKKNYYDLSSKNYEHILKLLKYKYLINIQEATECDNHNEVEFMAKLLLNLNIHNIDYLCEIINIVLSLNINKLCGYAEHLLQQLLPGIEYSHSDNGNNLLILKVSESILSAVIKNDKIVSLLLLELPLEDIIYIDNKSLKHYFLTNTVPAFVEGVCGYNILDRLWASFSKHTDKKSIHLQVLSVLSEYFLPMRNSNGVVKFESDVINQYVFWDLILYGLHSKIPSLRRMSIYLTKRAIDFCMINVYNISVKSEDGSEVFIWNKNEQESLKLKWDNYFVLLETLDESQSNIVLPCLQLLDVVKDIGWKWLNCAFMKGLTHPNFNIRLKCLQVRLKYSIKDNSEANLILSVLNDINLYDNIHDFKSIIDYVFDKQENFKYIIQELPTIKWSAVSLYHITNILANTKVNILKVVDEEDLINILCSLMQWPCNNIMIRTGVHINLLLYLRSICKYINWKNAIKLITNCPSDISINRKLSFIVSDCIQFLNVTNDEEKLQFMSFLTSSHIYHYITLMYLINNKNEIENYIQIINKKIATIEDITSRQYVQKMLCFGDFVYVATLMQICWDSKHQPENVLSTIIKRRFDTIFNYIQGLLSNEFDNIYLEQLEQFIESCRFLCLCVKEDKLLHLHKCSVLVLRSPTANFAQKFISVVILNKLICNSVIYKIDINILEEALGYVTSPNVIHNLLCLFGKVISNFFENICEIMYRIVNFECHSPSVKGNIKIILNIINCTRECGGYGCLKWNLKTMRILLPELLFDSSIFNFKEFLERSWKDVQEHNRQDEYLECLDGFIELVISEVILKEQEYAKLLLEYSLKIVEHGHVSNTTIVCLANVINRMQFDKDCHLQHILLSEILLFCPLLRKDQRITEKTTKLILDVSTVRDYYLKYDIQNIGVFTLLTIDDHNIFSAILLIIMNKIDKKIANIQRYHENTECHYMLLLALQNVLCICWLQSKHIDIEKVASWCVQLLAKLPHHASVKFYLEWIIALSFCFEEKKLNDACLQQINFESIPVVSQLMVLYYYISKNDTPLKEEYEYVINYLLSFSMGQNFNVRLAAQYLSLKLHNLYNNSLKIEKYDYIMKLIERTLKLGSHEKAYVKLKNDCIVNIFNIIQCLDTQFIYYYILACFNLTLHDVKTLAYIPGIDMCQKYILKHDGDRKLKDMWLNKKDLDQRLMEVANVNKVILTCKEQDVSTIQKKYIPWRNMADVEVFDTEKKKENQSQLIVVASLIDKLPNLGGMARTSEVFGVNTLVVDSLRHLQDTQFQGLSVSAERWVNIEEVRPGDPLKKYLGKMKSEGYTIVAAEQTSSSVTLQTFKFPVKTLLVLGHEKEGIPFELLPFMDHCVEIPQKGYVRSLNVHVTAAIFVWEYVRQNTL